jgi:hypothetical protein
MRILRIVQRLGLKVARLWEIWHLFRLSNKVAARSRPRSDMSPVVFFNASTRLGGMSLNAAFSFISAWGAQLSGVPVIHFACQSGMSRCVLGTDPDDPSAEPPCRRCIAQSNRLLASAPTRWFTYAPNIELLAALQDLGLEQLKNFEFSFPLGESKLAIPLGSLVLPSLRWALRKHNLPDHEPTRALFREYILSAYRVAQEFNSFIDEIEPRVIVIFNGLQYPEATARWIAQKRDLRVVTHEVGFQPFSAFFTDGEATAYPIDIPKDFDLTREQNKNLDQHLSRRFQGEFTMAGIRFWPEMRGLEEGLLQQAARFQQIVPVFTNVVFDTSQVHANVIFPDMFVWLDLVLKIIRAHSETFFVIRAHPDEKRPGSSKQSREPVSDWIERKQVAKLPNVVFVDSLEYISSYELIQRAKFVMVYNSSIGLEATLLGSPVLCGGKARYTQYPTVFFPDTQEGFRKKAEEFMAAEQLEVPEEHKRNARRFLYYQFFKVSLPFDNFIKIHSTPGYVQLKRFRWSQLLSEHSPTIRVIVNGILEGEPFLLKES